jgi:uncharacterized protein (TIGR02246 family)
VSWLIPVLIAVSAPAGIAAEAVRGVQAQAAAWNRGDLETALAGYCDSPDLIWVARSGVSRGFTEFAAGMRKDFADPAAMGRYDVEILHARTAGPHAALVTMRWSIVRGGKRLMGGVSTQLWQPCKGRLRIVLEHAS